MYIEAVDKTSYAVFGQSEIFVNEDRILLDGKGNKKHVIAECPPEYAPMVIAGLARLDGQQTPLATQDTVMKILRNAGYEHLDANQEIATADAN